jgi:regulator of sigma E protease
VFTFFKIVLGLFGLGIVVFIHELGHFIAARLSGIDVEAFSLGWGNPILKKKIGAVEYRLGLFPLGGYCKMREETDYEEVWKRQINGVEQPKGSFFAAKPWKRIVVAFAGPLFNFIFAVIVLSAIWGMGIEIKTLDNKIVILSDLDGQSYPSDKAGLASGDRIVEINGNEIGTYRDIQEHIALNPDTDLPLTVIRGNKEINLTIHPNLDKSGAGKIGVYPWVEPLVASVKADSAAERAGLKSGDLLRAINGEPLPYTVAFQKIIKDGSTSQFTIEYERSGVTQTAEFKNVTFESPLPDLGMLGIEFPLVEFKTPALSPPAALVEGVREASKTFAVSVKGLGLLFKKEIDLTQAVSGPARITYMVGDIAAGGFSESVAAGLSSAANFLALISIALCLMNLLPLPILDGGMIILYLIEMVRRRPIHPKAVSVFQTAGMVIIFGLMIFAAFNDILYFTGR